MLFISDSFLGFVCFIPYSYPHMTCAVSDYLLSNNHVNSLIVLKLDFSDEEVLAYYISFLKTLSFKLNTHTIHFFYNEVFAYITCTCVQLHVHA